MVRVFALSSGLPVTGSWAPSWAALMSLKEVVSQESPLGVCHPRDGLVQGNAGKDSGDFPP